MEEIEQKMMITNSVIYSQLVTQDIDLFLDIKKEFEEGFSAYKETGDTSLINTLDYSSDNNDFKLTAVSWKKFILN
jgi:hypothetical protein